MSFYQDPGLDPAKRIAANIQHDNEPHTVCMWIRARYKGGFGYPVEKESKPRTRLSREEFQRRRELAQKTLSI